MSQQTRIDEFYKSIGKQKSTVINVKKCARSKSVPYSKRRKEEGNEEANISLSENKLSDCIILYEKLNKMHDVNLNDAEIIQTNVQIASNNISLCGNDYLGGISQHELDKEYELPMIDTTNEIQRETLNENGNYLITSNNKLENSSNFNGQTPPNNISMKLQKTPESESRNNSYMKTSSPIIKDNCHLKDSPNKKLRTPDKNSFLFGNSNSSTPSTTPKKSNYTSKVPSDKSLRISPRKKLFGENIDTAILTEAIKCMNLARQDVSHKFDLTSIYFKNTFDTYSNIDNNINSEAVTKYKLSDIDLCDDLNAKTLFITIFLVLSNPINCSYFNEDELDFIFSIITLPKNAQMLLARMIKRKRTWFRKSSVVYPEIATELKHTFEVLALRSICSFDIKNEKLDTIIELLQVTEIQQLCKKMKINPKGNKKSNIQKLLQLSNKKPLFPGMKTPGSILYDSILEIIDFCVCINFKTWNIIEKIIILLMPNQDPANSLADTFHMLCDIYLGKIIFPKNSGHYFPIFSSELHLTSYVAVRSVLSTTLHYIEKKNWKEVKNNGNYAMNTLKSLLKDESLRLENSMLPKHVTRYMPAFVWMKILSISIEAFKKDKDKEAKDGKNGDGTNKNKKRVVEILLFLLEQNCYMDECKGKWYDELALIEMYHHKDLEACASIIIKALNTENITQTDKINLIKRARKIVKKKDGIKPSTRDTLNKILGNHRILEDVSAMFYQNMSVTIYAAEMPRNTAGSKSTWCIKSNTDGQSYGSVEDVALHYYQKQGFPNGLHCEGALPITLFCTLFWDELYDVHVPGAFSSPYQEAPNDLFTGEFYENRKEKIDIKLQFIGNFSSELLSSFMQEKFAEFGRYQSIMSSNPIKSDSLQLKQIVHCLGTQGVIGICKRLIDNFKLWKAGFPDLIVWDYDTKKHKIIEVKGPGDALSTKQQSWLEYLHHLELNTEVCLVQDIMSHK
ncbi:fanconi-associated nuclease 1-like [Bombus pascuorum]|uniref:fanconi-associated nuclease 1-like n=1 Tax=Bombus pascuorum TaxID=65598 RepID=UPI0021451D65|nr:fanconi-associated nuclease 1-like [Bombus pascuorum]